MLATLAVIAVIALLVHVAAALYLAELFTRSKRRRVEGTPGDLGLRYEDVQFAAEDGISLHGWYLESPGARGTLVLVHDFDGTRADKMHGLLTLQRDYLRRGFNVLAFDLRGRGESGGTRDYLGARERRDLPAAVEFARERAPLLPVVVHGFGLGGALAVVGVADGSVDADAVIADSPFTSVRAYLRRRWAIVPWHLFTLSSYFAKRLFHADPDAIAPLEAMRSTTSLVPMLFIHGERDRLISVTHTINIAASSMNARTSVYRVPRAGHCTSYLRGSENYVRHCLDFVDGAVPARRISVAAAG
jgi:alpha-beta hydrolase superfamily lysophospholipase